jgi:hypothetical protein
MPRTLLYRRRPTPGRRRSSSSASGGDLRAGILAAHWRIHRENWPVQKALDEYFRLDANTWDSVNLVDVLKANAAKN